MSQTLRFPPINPFRFAPADLQLPAKWCYPPFGTALHADSLKRYQVQETYHQKLCTSDPVCIQYHRSRAGDNTPVSNPSELRIFELGSNALLKTLGFHSAYNTNYDLAGLTDEATGEQLYTEQWLFTPAQLSELTGKKHIYFELWHYFDDIEGVTVYRGNPIELRTVHPGTSLVEYNQTMNGHDILFEQLMPRFAYRIESNGMNFEPGGDYTVFEDQDRSTVALDADAFNVFKWDIGGDHGLPEYMIDVVNRSLQCCRDGFFRIDGREYVWQDGKLNSSGNEGKHVQWRSVTLRQKNEADGYTFYKRKIPLFTAVDYPFAIDICAISDGFSTISVVTNGGYAKVFDDEAGLDAWIGEFNTNIAAAGFTGEVVRADNDVYFLRGENERFRLLGFPPQIFPDVLQFTATASVPSQRYFQYKLTYPDAALHSHIVCYGSTSGSEEVQHNAIGSNTVTVTHEYTTSGSKVVRLFHRNEETAFESVRGNLGAGSTIVKINDVSGKVSSSLSLFRLYLHDFSALAELDLSFLAPAKNSLQQLYLDRSTINAIAAGWASSLVSAGYKPFWLLRYVEIMTNTLSSSAVDDFLVEFYSYCNVLPGGHLSTINISGNIPAAPPTGTSFFARAGFTDKLWKIITD